METPATPQPPDPASFRRAMAAMPAAVSVVAAPTEAGPAGATANAVTSLSLEPPLMLAALDRGSRTLAAAQRAGVFAVSVLDAGQEGAARALATKAPHPEKWSGVAWTERDGAPIVDGCVVWAVCDLRDEHDGGDHVILTGRVRAIGGDGGDPLVFHAGAYRPLG